jgi:hypothetical protein
VAENNPFKPKQLVDVNQVCEFGAFHQAEGTTEAEALESRDYTYVPGFSGMRVRRDMDLTKLHRNEIKGKDVSVLPVNLRWFRTVKGSGSDPDQMRMAHARNLKYRPADKDDVGKEWLTEMPPGGMYAPDGTIRSAAGDLALHVIDQQGAARIAMRRKQAVDESVSGLQQSGLVQELKIGEVTK